MNNGSISSGEIMLNTTMLNKEQLKAVDCESFDGESNKSPLLIIAGAGTGKTNTLAHKTAQLVLNGASPDRI